MTDTMTDGSPNDPPGASGSTGGPPWSGPPGPFAGLRRSEHDRWIAGVAAGVGRHLGIDLWLARTIALGLAVIGIGVPLYILGWLLLPTESRPSIASERDWNRNTVIAVCALVVVASLAVFGPGDVATPWRALPWVVVGLGVLLLVRPSGSRAVPSPPTAPPAGGPPPPYPGAPTPTSTIVPPPPPPSPPPTSTGGAPGADAPTPPAGTPGVVTPDATAPLPRPPRRVSLLTPLTLFVLVALTGGAILLGARPGVVAAVALCVIGAVLILSSVVGRAGGLVAVGVLVALPLLVVLAAGPKWNDWRNRTYRPVTSSVVTRSYERGVGRTVLDLRRLRFPETRPARVDLDQVAGEVVVWLPDDATTRLSADVVAGSIEVADVDRDDGVGAEVHRRLVTGTGRSDLRLDVDLVAGRIEVRRGDLRSSSGVRVKPTTPPDPTPAPEPTTPSLPLSTQPTTPSVPTTGGAR
jgi:phage shock protein PspC (stress-responsive transcriptional regulator)